MTTVNNDGTLDTLVQTYCTSSSDCPDGGMVVNSPLVVSANNPGTAGEGITDGEPAIDNWYMFYASYTGVVYWAPSFCP